jgi:hypothetical protein
MISIQLPDWDVYYVAPTPWSIPRSWEVLLKVDL